MTINKELNQDELIIKIGGRLDTNTSPDLEKEVKESIDDVKTVVFDLCDLDYISSAGLRVLLATQKTMNHQGSMKVTNVKPEIMEIFEVTGFTDILTIE